MGAWGYGILQNDSAQDGMCDVANQIQIDITSLAKEGSAENAAKLAAGTALLLQFSQYSFNPENDFYEKLIQALTVNQNYIQDLPGNSAEVLNAVMDGHGAELAGRDGVIDADIDKALHSDEDEGFIMQKAFSVIEPDLFLHPTSAAYLQQTVDGLVAQVDEEFADEEMLSDLSREAECMGAFGLLLIIPKAQVPPEKFTQWRNQFHEVWDEMEATGDEIEDGFAEQYNSFLEVGFQCGIKRYSVE